MIDTLGDLWAYDAQVTAITTNGHVKGNGECVMGRGCALQAKERYPTLPSRLGSLIREHGNRCFKIAQFDKLLLTFPVKHIWNEQADLHLIQKSCGEAMAMADKFAWESIVLPRPGCGNGGLDYAVVRLTLVEHLDDRFHVITWAL